MVIHGAVASAAGAAVTGLWPQNALGAFVKSTGTGAAIVGFVVFLLVATTCVLLTACKVGLPFAPKHDEVVQVIDKRPSNIAAQRVAVDIDGTAKDLPRYSALLTRRTSAKAPIGDDARDVAADVGDVKK